MLGRSSLHPSLAQPPAPTPHADADLVVAEHELHEFVIEVDALYVLWPKGKGAVQRARIGRRIEDALSRIAELYGVITSTQPETLQGAAVQLRRALAMIEDTNVSARRLIDSALNVVEASADDVAVPASR